MADDPRSLSEQVRELAGVIEAALPNVDQVADSAASVLRDTPPGPGERLLQHHLRRTVKAMSNVKDGADLVRRELAELRAQIPGGDDADRDPHGEASLAHRRGFMTNR